MSQVRHVLGKPTKRRVQPPAKSAPDALRRRVLANVHSEPEPIETWLLRAVRGATFGRPRLASALLASALVIGTACLIALGGSSGSLGRTSLAPELRGAHASLKRVGNHAELSISGMPQAPVGEVYEVWLSRTGAEPRPTDALFTVTKDGNGSVEVPGSLRGVREVMVTSEPVGGSSHPSSPALLRVLLGRGDSSS